MCPIVRLRAALLIGVLLAMGDGRSAHAATRAPHQQQSARMADGRNAPAGTSRVKPTQLAFGIISSVRTFTARYQQHIQHWWRPSLSGAVYADALEPEQRGVAPANLLIRPQKELVVSRRPSHDSMSDQSRHRLGKQSP